MKKGNHLSLYLIYLYATIFLTGASSMVLEIIGAKLISPVFGASHFVWMSQISITLLSLSLGAFLSSYIKKNNLTFLLTLQVLSSIYLILTNLFFKSISYSFLSYPFLVATVLTSLILYFFPLTVLGLMFPYIADEIKTLSQKSSFGKISALSTVGSVFGTVVSGGFLIRYFDNQSILLYISFLNILWAFLFLYFKDKKKLNILSITLPLGLMTIVSLFYTQKENNSSDLRIIEKRNSPFGEIALAEKGYKRMLLNEGLVQLTYNFVIDKPANIFTYALSELSLITRPEIKKALHIGVGGGIVPTEFQKLGIENTAVEINETMIGFAKKYFKYDDKKIKTHIQDGRFFVKTCKDKFDVVILDAFLVDSVPTLLLTQEAFREIKSVLNPNGIIVINSFGKINPPTVLTKSISKTLKTVYNNVKVFSLDRFNVFFLASDGEISFKKEPNYEEINPDLQEGIRELIKKEISLNDSSGIIMTDDFNQIEIYDDNPTELFRKKVLLDLTKTE